MGHDDPCVGIDFEQGLQAHEVHRRLQQPPRGAHTAGLQELQKAPVPAEVSGLVSRLEKPLAVVGKISLGHELKAGEVQRHHPDALLGRVRLHVVLSAEVGNQLEKLVELGANRIDAVVVPIAFGRRRGVRQQALPAQRRAVRRVLVEQRLQYGGARARHADDEQGFGDRIVEDLRPFGDGPFHLEADICHSLQQGLEGELAEGVQPGVGLDGGDQPIKPLGQAVVGIRMARRLGGLGQYPAPVQLEQRDAASFDQGAHGVDGLERPGMLDGDWGVVHQWLHELLELGGDRHVPLDLDLAGSDGHEGLDLPPLQLAVGVE